MAFTAGFSVNVGDPTKASDVDVLAANDDYLKNAIDTFIANDANNRVLTGTGSGTANAETNLTFDGSTLTVTGTVSATTFSGNVTGNLTGDVTGNISGNVTGGTISGTTGTFSGDLAVGTNKLFVDVSESRVGISTSSPDGTLHVHTGSAGSVTAHGSADDLVIEHASDAGLSILTPAANNGRIYFGSPTNNAYGQIDYDHATNDMVFATAGSGKLTITGAGNVGIGTSSPTTFAGYTTLHHKNSSGDVVQLAENDNGVIHQIIASGTNTVLIGSRSNHDLKIGSNDTTAITVDTSQRVGIGTSSPSTKLVVSDGTYGFEVNPTGYQVDLFSYNRSTSAYHDMRIDSEQLILRTGNPIAERMRILSDGRIGIGTSSPDVNTDLHILNNAVAQIRLTTGSASNTYLTFGDSLDVDAGRIIYANATDSMLFYTSGSSAMTIDSSQNVGIGQSSPSGRLHVEGGGIYHIGSSLKYIASSSVQSISSTNNAGAELTTDAYLWINRSSAPCVFLNRTTTTGQIAVFYSDLTAVGSISVTASATAYNTSSDYRLKENLAPITGAVDRVNALQPRRFNFISDPDTTVDGFLAHEVSDIVPEAITGEKDAVDADGNPEYQGIDQSKLVPLLTAAIQELTARIEALEAA